MRCIKKDTNHGKRSPSRRSRNATMLRPDARGRKTSSQMEREGPRYTRRRGKLRRQPRFKEERLSELQRNRTTCNKQTNRSTVERELASLDQTWNGTCERLRETARARPRNRETSLGEDTVQARRRKKLITIRSEKLTSSTVATEAVLGEPGLNSGVFHVKKNPPPPERGSGCGTWTPKETRCNSKKKRRVPNPRVAT